ncbi:MAG: nucleoside 2-deoxyribosyltransferase [Candidatus Aenigmarchaeota archaeon]|nr:nucleoside 2-deoxyribosyltransferase [Candidatus Aenigmarchaeota archaeon]
MDEKLTIYIAAPLFNAADTYFNSQIAERLEKIGYATNLPQRDGFEFGNLEKALTDYLNPDQVGPAVQNVIYFLDMGVLVPDSDVVLARLDEPLDEGAVVELTRAKDMDKCTIGFRTDARTPYGSSEDDLKGMHFFPAYQCNEFISHYMPSKTPEEREQQMESLIEKIDQTIEEAEIIPKKELPDYITSNPNINSILEGAELLFQGISDIHSREGLKKIASRYLDYETELGKIKPKVR